MAVDPEQIINFNGVDMPLKDAPREIRGMFGMGHHMPTLRHEGREVQPGDWPYKPEDCLRADEMRGVWLNDEMLVCPGCGVDCT